MVFITRNTLNKQTRCLHITVPPSPPSFSSWHTLDRWYPLHPDKDNTSQHHNHARGIFLENDFWISPQFSAKYNDISAYKVVVTYLHNPYPGLINTQHKSAATPANAQLKVKNFNYPNLRKNFKGNIGGGRARNCMECLNIRQWICGILWSGDEGYRAWSPSFTYCQLLTLGWVPPMFTWCSKIRITDMVF